MRALVVDDSRAMRTILKKLLVGEGFEVVEAGDGREALERLAADTVPAIALVDWNMPVMNGLELIRAIRAIRRYDEMPLLMVTTETETTQIARALAAGADEYAMKPFTREALASKLALLGVSAGARLHERSS